jgi:hypothetical protein
MVAVPVPSPLATPSVPAALEMVAIAPEDVDQLTTVVRSCVVPSL